MQALLVARACTLAPAAAEAALESEAATRAALLQVPAATLAADAAVRAFAAAVARRPRRVRDDGGRRRRRARGDAAAAAALPRALVVRLGESACSRRGAARCAGRARPRRTTSFEGR